MEIYELTRLINRVIVNLLTGDPEEIGTRRKFSKIKAKGQKLMAKWVSLVEDKYVN